MMRPQSRSLTPRQCMPGRIANLLLVATLLSLSLMGLNAQAESMHALVIGNAAYPNGKLANPTHDAQLMGKTLEDLGFKVTTRIDQTQQQMDQEIGDFCRNVPKNGLALFFFAGHGLQINGENYLVPIDAKLHDEAAVKYKTVSQNFVIDSLYASTSNMNVVVLDCCRDNPFQRAWKRGAANRGLAPAQVIPEGTLIAYATSPGDTALDGTGENSPYTAELAKAFSQRPAGGLLLRDVFFKASAAVRKATGQRPWLNLDASLDAFYLQQPQKMADRDELNQVAMKIESGIPLNDVERHDDSLPTPRPVTSSGDDASKPTQTESASMGSINEAPMDHSLMRQADTFLYEGEYDLAIEAFSVLIGDSNLPKESQLKVRRSRGVAYLGRRKDRDIERAILDYKACGEDGVRMSILMDTVDLKVGKESRGKARKNQIALVTLSRGDWLWIESVQDNRSIQGWVKKEAFVKSQLQVQPEPPKTTSKPQPVYANSAAPTKSTSASNGSSPVVSSIPSTGMVQSSGVIQSNGAIQPYNPNMTQPTQSFPTNGTTYVPSQQIASPNQFSSSQPQSQYRSAAPQQFQSTNQYRQPQTIYNQQSNQNFQSNLSTNSRSSAPSGADGFTKKYMQKNSRPPSIWETPKWESPAEIRRLRAQGLVR